MMTEQCEHPQAESKSLYSLTADRIMRETAGYFELNKRKSAVGLAVAVGGYLVLAQVFGIDQAVGQVVNWLLAIVVPTAVVMLLVVGSKAITIPAAIYQESIAERRALEDVNSSLRSSFQPRLGLEFRPEPPFEQLNSLFDSSGNVAPGQRRLYRVGIRCLSPANSAVQVRVDLACIAPPIIAFLPIALHHMHDNPLPGQAFQKTVDLCPDETRLVDVISIIKGNNVVDFHDNFILHYATDTVPNLIPARSYTISVVARAKDCPATRMEFAIEEDAERGYRFGVLQGQPTGGIQHPPLVPEV